MLHIPLARLTEREIYRYAGEPASSAPALATLYAACRTEILSLIQACAAWQTYDYDPASGVLHSDGESLALAGQSIINHLAACHRATVMCVTIGAALEEAASAAFRQGAYAKALLFDSAGSAAVEQAADYVNNLITDIAARAGWHTTPRFSPGYGDWPLTSQPALVAWSHGQDLGIKVTPSYMLQPRKSITAVIGWTNRNVTAEAAGCDACQFTACRLRRTSTAAKNTKHR